MAQSDPSSRSFAPSGPPPPVVKPGEFPFAAAFLDHPHIYNQCHGLIDAGATLEWVYDPDPAKVTSFREKFPEVRVARDFDEVLADPNIKLVTAAGVPSERVAAGCRVMDAGKDYFCDKAPFTTLAQLETARAAVARTGRKYMVYYAERLQSEAGMHAGELIRGGAIGRVIHILGLGPHRLNKPVRPAWFFQREKMGGILCDIGSHQCEQFLHYSGASDATITHATVANVANPDTPEFEDFGELSLVGDNGTSNYSRVDWFTPDGLRIWGDSRTIVTGTHGYIELRKCIDIARDQTGEHLYLVDDRGEHHIELAGKVGFPFFGQLIRDCLERTETAMTQTHAFKAAELALRAQAAAQRIA